MAPLGSLGPQDVEGRLGDRAPLKWGLKGFPDRREIEGFKAFTGDLETQERKGREAQ